MMHLARGTGVVAVMVAAGLVLGAAGPAAAASNDNDVEWNGVFSYPGDRAPLHPARNQAFTVELRVYRGDITAARVRTWDGAERFHAMAWNRNDGAYDIWRGTVAGTSADYLYYYFEVTDGSDTDYYNALGMWSDPPPRGDFLVHLTPYGGHPLGATAVAGGTVFRVWAPNATSAAVAGSFNGWSTTAHRMAGTQGFWEVRVPGAAAGGEYKFVFDGDLWRTDPRARRQTSSVGNSVVANPAAYVWGDAGWVTPYFEDMIVYELHVGTFSGEGDGTGHSPGRYRDAADAHLAHLRELGVNVVEVMPVGEFAGDRSWGYNPSFLFAPESIYGSPDDFKYLVDRCHQNGIAVILDVVYNHLGGSDLAGNLLDYDGEEIYFYPQGNGYRDTPWGPRPDYGRVEVRDFIRDNVRYWLEEFHLDGFRLDGTDFVKVNAEGWQLLKDIAQAVDTVSPKAVVIAEQLPNDPAVTRSIDAGGAGADYQWNDRLHDELRGAIWAAGHFGDPSMPGIAAGLDHDGYPGTSMVNYIESHDEVADQGPMSGRVSWIADGSNPESAYAYGRARVAAALVLFSAGMPMLLQGQELLEERRFGDAPENRIQWRYRQEHADFFLFMKDAVRLRRSQPALRSSARQNVFHVNDGANVLAFQRWTDAGDDLVVVVSLNDADFDAYQLGFPLAGEWFEILNGDAAAYGGSNRGNGGRITAAGGARDGLPSSAAIVIPARGVLVFARAPLTPPEEPGFRRADCDGDGTVDLGDALRLIWTLFLDAESGDCPAACDANADGAVDVADVLHGLRFLFRSGPAPAGPFPDCGPNPGSLPCASACAGM